MFQVAKGKVTLHDGREIALVVDGVDAFKYDIKTNNWAGGGLFKPIYGAYYAKGIVFANR